MTKINRYVLSSFLSPLIWSFGSLSILVVMSELMERLRKLLSSGAGPKVVAQYLLAVLPVHAVEIFPISGLLAVLFCLGNLSRRREITAAMAGGLHPWRIAKPILWSGVVLSIFSWGLTETVVPWAHRRMKTLWNSDIRHFSSSRQTRFDDVIVAEGRDVIFAMDVLDIKQGRMERPVIDETEQGQPRRQYTAESARWTGKNWVMENGAMREFSRKDGGSSISRQTPFVSQETTFRQSPQELAPTETDTDDMSYRELHQKLKRLRRLGAATHRLEVDLQSKLAFPWANFIIIFLGIPFAFNKTGGKVKAIGLALGVAFVYFGLMQVGRALGQKPWCPPFAAAWLANIIFLALGTRLFFEMRRLA